jgi:hypothetical protein
MAKACGVVLFFGTNQHSGIILPFIELGDHRLKIGW